MLFGKYQSCCIIGNLPQFDGGPYLHTRYVHMCANCTLHILGYVLLLLVYFVICCGHAVETLDFGGGQSDQGARGFGRAPKTDPPATRTLTTLPTRSLLPVLSALIRV